MFGFTAVIRRNSAKGEKTGWTFVEIPHDVISRLRLPDKKGFRIKAQMDNVPFSGMSTYPVGEGRFIIAVNSELKQKLGKKEGAPVRIRFERDQSGAPISEELMHALAEDPQALSQFRSLLPLHRNYFHRYVETAKTTPTKTARILNTINAMLRKQDFSEMMRSLKTNRH